MAMITIATGSPNVELVLAHSSSCIGLNKDGIHSSRSCSFCAATFVRIPGFAFEIMFVSAPAVLLTALLPAALAFSPSFPYGTEKVRGVSIGGWLVLEVRISNFVSVCIGIDADAPRLVTSLACHGVAVDHPELIRRYRQPRYRRRVVVWGIARPSCSGAGSRGPLGLLDNGG
jgi:hypothetical protein